MKKLISVLLALVFTLGLACAFADEAALPAYAWSGEDPVIAAVIEYMQTNDFGYEPEEGGVLIPTPIILKTDPEEYGDDTAQVQVYGNFWIFCYVLEGKNLRCTSGGENPGIITVVKEDGAWKVSAVDFAVEGSEYAECIKRYANGDEQLEKNYYDTTSSSEDSFVPQWQHAAVHEYVTENGLDIETYQPIGEEPSAILN